MIILGASKGTSLRVASARGTRLDAVRLPALRLNGPSRVNEFAPRCPEQSRLYLLLDLQ